jgi:hypothetical protein
MYMPNIKKYFQRKNIHKKWFSWKYFYAKTNEVNIWIFYELDCMNSST